MTISNWIVLCQKHGHRPGFVKADKDTDITNWASTNYQDSIGLKPATHRLQSSQLYY